jgi:hypothetical protein
MQISVHLPRMEKGNSTGLALANCFSGELVLIAGFTVTSAPQLAALSLVAFGSSLSN